MNLFQLAATLILLFFATIILPFSRVHGADFHEMGKWQVNPTIQRELTSGKSVDNIIRDVLLWKGMTPRDATANLYCLGISATIMEDAAKANGINQESLISGYDLAKDECPETTIADKPKLDRGL